MKGVCCGEEEEKGCRGKSCGLVCGREKMRGGEFVEDERERVGEH